MKNIKKIYAFIACMMLIGSLNLTATNTKADVTINYEDFYNALSPYGSWINYPGYGNVWHPNVADFRPYATNGYWENTDEGLYWESGYEWGWAPFHYGSWDYDDQYGWLWIPGYDWAPAWVTWGKYNDNYAWAPIGPGIDLAVNGWDNWRPDHDYYWNMVPKNNITDHNISSHLIAENDIRNNASRISLLNNFQHNTANHYYSVGPDNHAVSGAIGKNVTPVRLTDADRQPEMRATNTARSVTPVGLNANSEKQVYRPQVTRPQETNNQTIPVRTIDAANSNPLRANEGWPQADFNRQRSNIESLPTREAPMHDFGPAGRSMRESGMGGGIHGGGGHR
ncbi:MAG: hypothetical protein LUE98_12145 [Tannerellaceae bacterium]|nr:hypothetical protein [Tannerellaceae bacterium]